ncbi:hypothetical protein [Streptomyces sioyaensis]|uniref:hypothetical protein n=1 Tax=Streptomyces sioyaensis TaxID=67364 RepID=UPI003F540AED
MADEELAAIDEQLAATEREYGLHQVSRAERTTAARPTRAEDEGGRPTPNPWHQATAAIERIPTLLDGDDAAAQVHLVAFGEALAALPPSIRALAAGDRRRPEDRREWLPEAARATTARRRRAAGSPSGCPGP